MDFEERKGRRNPDALAQQINAPEKHATNKFLPFSVSTTDTPKPWKIKTIKFLYILLKAPFADRETRCKWRVVETNSASKV
jgi:hypothetical protein